MLKSERLTLLEPTYSLKAIQKMVVWLNDVEVVKYSQQRHQHHTLATQTAYIASFKAPDVFKEIYYNDELIGTITAAVDPYNSVADVGIMIGKEYWGRGFGAEAWKLFCHSLPQRKIEAGCDHRNFAMIKICEDFRMIEEGRKLNRFVTANESYSDMLMFGKYPK